MSISLDSDTPFLESVLMRMSGFLYRCRADKEFTMIELTSGFERCSGFSASVVIGNKVRSFASLIHPDDGAAVDEAVVRGLEQRKNWNINYRLLHASSHYIWVHEDGGGVWDETNAVAYLEGVVWDIQHLYASLETQFTRPNQG
jgi:PAS domain S-box-containing protein